MLKCKDCAAVRMTQDGRSICGYMETAIDLEKPACQNRVPIESITKCDVCGLALPISAAVVYFRNTEDINFLCPKCQRNLNTCATCINGNLCDFKTNPIPLPHQVQKTVRKGNAVMSTTIQNPERIKETCQKNCSCWSDEEGCLKQNGWCGAYAFSAER